MLVLFQRFNFQFKLLYGPIIKIDGQKREIKFDWALIFSQKKNVMLQVTYFVTYKLWVLIYKINFKRYSLDNKR